MAEAPPGLQMVDLVGQYRAIREEILAAIEEVLESGQFIRGPVVARLEEELASYLGCRFALGVGNGTDALQLAYMALGLKPGDEVIVPAFTFVDRKSTRLNSSHVRISYAVFCLKKKKKTKK